MATKTLTQLAGSRHELGEIIRSKATSLDDGRSLIECDGEITVSKPLLDAVLPDGMHMAHPTLVADSGGVKLIRAEKFDISDTNDIFLGISSEVNSEIEHFDDGGTRAAATNVGFIGDVAVNADGSQSYVASIEDSTFDLEILHNITSGIPNAAKDIDTGQNYQGTSLAALISNNGEICKIIAASDNDDINVWTSTDGPDGTWSEITPINPAAAVARIMGPTRGARGNSTLSEMVVPTDKGLWISDDSGATWTEDILLPNGQDPFSVAVTEAGIIYAVDALDTNFVYKTTDKGTNWTVIFDLGKRMRSMANLSQKHITLSNVEVDSSDNIYVLAFEQPTATGASKAMIYLWYSSDGGVTWVMSSLKFTSRPDGTGTVPFPLGTKECRINAAGTRLAWAVNTGTDADNIYLSVITKGKFPPNIQGEDWKMVAD